MGRLAPSISIDDFDDAIENHLVSRINDLWPPPANPDEDDDRIEALRSDLHGAIAKVFGDHGVSVVQACPGAISGRSARA
jgi:hypothetical protein